MLDPYFLGPLWEFSYQHCLFDPVKTNKINGYYDLKALNKKLSELLIRREKRNVLDQLPDGSGRSLSIREGLLASRAGQGHGQRSVRT